MRKTFTAFLLPLILTAMTQCKFVTVDQPSNAMPDEQINISLTVYDDTVPEPNPHRGLLCVLMPDDWRFIAADYTSDVGDGTLSYSPAWTDSVEACYPNTQMGEHMKWIALISDTGYAYDDPLTIDIDLSLRAGDREGCFQMGYLATKATQDLLCTSWSAISYPHPMGVPDSCGASQVFETRIETGWDDLFNRTSGWTGADGIYSIPLDGLEKPSSNSTARTFFVFSDTFIGDVDENGSRQNWRLVNNTYALLSGTQPIDDNIQFHWVTGEGNNPVSVFIPDTPNTNPGDWYWLMDGIALNGKIHVFGLRLESGSGGLFNFRVVGVTLLSFELDSEERVAGYTQTETPFYYEHNNGDWEIVLGQAVMPMTEESGQPDGDGYIYVYGPRNGSGAKQLVASRVLPEEFENFQAWQFWDGAGWSNDIAGCASITSGISQEFSVTPLDNGEFILVFESNNGIGIRLGESPVGPFDFHHIIYDCPEPGTDPNIFVYNAKAHPHLSEANRLLISYNVNTFSFADHIQYAEIYRPRFVSLKLSSDSNVFDPFVMKAQTFSLDQNYPNPFNAGTMIHFTISESESVALKIYNVVGKEIRTLVEEWMPAGSYTLRWDGKNNSGSPVSTGIYMMTLEMRHEIISRKMIHLK